MFNWCFLMFIVLCVHQIFVRWCPIIVHSGSDVRALMSRQSCVDYQAFFCSPEFCTFIFSLSFLGFQTSVLSSDFFACFSNFSGILQTIFRSPDSRAFMIRISCIQVPNFLHLSPDVCAIIFGQCAFNVILPCIHHTFLRAWLALGAFAILFCVNVQSFVLPYTDFCMFRSKISGFSRPLSSFGSVFCKFKSKRLWVQQTFERSCSNFVRSCSWFCAFKIKVSLVHVQTFVL